MCKWLGWRKLLRDGLRCLAATPSSPAILLLPPPALRERGHRRPLPTSCRSAHLLGPPLQPADSVSGGSSLRGSRIVWNGAGGLKHVPNRIGRGIRHGGEHGGRPFRAPARQSRRGRLPRGAHSPWQSCHAPQPRTRCRGQLGWRRHRAPSRVRAALWPRRHWTGTVT